MKEMYGHIPINLDLESFKQRDKYYFLITFIIYGRVFDKRKDSRSFIQLYSNFLKSVLSGHYKDYIKDLVEMEVIETDNRYIKNEKSKAYRLTANYGDVKTMQVNIEDKNIISKYWNYKSEQKKRISGSNYKHIFSCLEKVEIDYEAAKSFINNAALEIEQFNSWNCSIDMIHYKDWFFTVDRTAGRIHNNITNLPKDFRQFLRIKDKKLVEVDISNSQPLLLNILISRYLFRYTEYSGNILPYVPQNSDLRLYKELTEQGKFYEYMMDKLSIIEDRSTFKVRIFREVFYGRENESEEWKQFMKIFPTVAEVVSYYKKVNYKVLAIELQRIEADIMINSVVQKLAEQKIYSLTIHDSILTTHDRLGEVEEIIVNEFMRYKLRPTLKIKN